MSDTASRRGVLAAAAVLPFIAAAARAQAPQGAGAGAGAGAGPGAGPGTAQPAPTPQTGTPPSVITQPPRQFGPSAPPTLSPDPDIIAVDPSFRQLLIGQATLQRLATGYELLEGPAWSNQGQYLVYSDVKADTVYRYIWETGAISAFRKPSYGTNGNTFDHQGRHLSCQDFFRRVVRWEHDGSLTVLADKFDGKPLNSPNDIAPHKDGSVWFTDPPFGGTLAEGHPDEAGSPSNPQGVRDARIGAGGTGLIGSQRQVLPASVYRIDPDGRVDLVVPFETGLNPNGIAFSPDYTKVYITRGASVFVGEVVGRGIKDLRIFTEARVDGIATRPDGLRIDRAGNLWCGASGPLGYAGVTVWNPDGKLLGRIRLPESALNVCFGGPKRDHLIMMGTSSIYKLHVNIQGAAPG